jgi:hypothetical protein
MNIPGALPAVLAGLGLLLAGCGANMPMPLPGLNRQLQQVGSSREPALSDQWLALIVGRGGREQVLLLDLQRQLPVPLPNLNRADSQPLSVAVDASGERLVLVRLLEGRTELLLYRRSMASLQLIPMLPPGVPQQLSLRADGRELAVQVGRNGLWQVDLIPLPER